MTGAWLRAANRCLVIGEVALAHDGSLGMALAYVDAIADAGAHAVKFQTHIAEAESTIQEPFRVALSGQDATRYDYWKRTAFDERGWRTLVERAHARQLLAISSPFSLEAVDLLVNVGMDGLKIASGEVNNLPLVQYAASRGLPLLLSSGFSSIAEIDAAVEVVRSSSSPFAVFQCTTAYPCPPEMIGLNMIECFRELYDCPIGLSDHSGTIFPGIVAAMLGCSLLEVHVCFSKAMYGVDVPASLTFDDLKRLVEGVAFVECAKAHPVDKDLAARALVPMRQLFTRSIVAASALPAGTNLTRDMLAFKKPGTGIPVSKIDTVLGRQLSRDVETDHFFCYDDFCDD